MRDSKLGIRRFFYGYPISFVLIFVILLLLPSCKTNEQPTISLEQAKKLTANLEKPLLIPPPRTVNNLLGDLTRISANRDNVLANFLLRADMKPDPNNMARDLGYRAEAARLLGRHGQAIEDARKVLEISKEPSARRVSYHILSMAYGDLGNYDEALGFMLKRRANATGPGQIITDDAMLGTLRALNGDFDGADKDLATAKANIAAFNMRSWDDQTFVPMIDASWDIAAGEIALLRGNYAKAERLLRQMISDLDEQIANGLSKNRTTPKGRTLEEVRFLARTHGSQKLALAVLRQGRPVEAEVIARDNLRMQARVFGRYSGQVLDGLRALSEITTEQGRFEDAEKLVNASLDIYNRIGAKKNSITRGATRRTLGDIYVGQSRWQDAQKVYDSVSQDLSGRPTGLEHVFNNNLNWAISLIRSERGIEAIARLRKTYATFVDRVGKNNYDSAEARGMLASAQTVAGNTRQALDSFIVSVPFLLSRSNSSEAGGTASSGRLMRLRFILDTYMGLLQSVANTGNKLPNGINPIEEAFRIADAARGGSVREALASSAARAASGDPELAELARQEQNTIRRIGALTDVLRNATGGDPIASRTLKKKILTLRAARLVIMKEITGRFPNYSDLIDPKPATIVEIRKALRPSEALISTYSTIERTYVWAVPQSGKVAFTSASLGIEELSDTVTLLRLALDPDAQTLGDIPEFDVEVAYELYKHLLKPVEEGWKKARTLLVVAHGPLGYLPLSLLPTMQQKLPADKKLLFDGYQSIQWLARSHALTSLPSAASLRAFRNFTVTAPNRKIFAGFGDPVFSSEQAQIITEKKRQPARMALLSNNGLKTRGLPVQIRSAPQNQNLDSADLTSLPRLPTTAEEVKSMAVALGADPLKSVFLGRNASEERVKSMNLSDIKVLAFATHGLVSGDLNGLMEPALALTSPEVIGGTDDGLLTMTEVLRLKLNSDWVVLSACNTGSGNGAGAEAVSGLGRAFFYAGTRALLVSNWPVETTSAKALTTKLFRRQAEKKEMGRAEALRQVVVALIEGDGRLDATTGRPMFSYGHPIFWAPFTLIGDGGVSIPGA